MGLSLKCARCHDHKFDPVTTREYYGLYAIFDSTKFPWAGGEEFQSKKFPREHFTPLIPAYEVQPLMAGHAQYERQFDERVAKLEAESPLPESIELWSELGASLQAADASHFEITAAQGQYDKDKGKLDGQKAEIRAPLEAVRRRGFPDAVPIAYAVREGKPHSVAVQAHGVIPANQVLAMSLRG